MHDDRSARGLESLRKEAKRWLAALRSGDAAARERFIRAVPNSPADPVLRDVQHALARERGFAGWSELKDAAMIAPYEAIVDALLDAYRTGTPGAMARFHAYTWHRRAWPALRAYVQLDLGKRPGASGGDVEITRDDARYLVARERGFGTWEALARAVRTHAEPPSRSLVPSREITDDMLDLFDNVEQITHLDLSGARGVTDRGMRLLGRFSNLESIDLSGTSITDDAAMFLRDCPTLRRVNLAFTATGDAAIRALAGNARLRSLTTGDRVTDAGIPLLHGIPAFTTWMGEPGHAAFFDEAIIPNQLALRGTFTDAGMRHMRGLDGLYALDVDNRRLAIGRDSMLAVAELPNLGRLACDAKDDWMPVIARMPALRFLGIQDTPAGDDGFSALGESRTIEYIWGRRCHNLRTRGFLSLARMPALRGLSVSCLNVAEEGIAALPEFPALVELMPMDVPDRWYQHIGACERLESLILMYCRETTDAATEHIARLPRLSYYFNSYTTITDRTPALLSRMPSLERVTFDACHNLTNDGVAALARLPNLRELRVSGRGLTPDVEDAFPPSVAVDFSL